MGDKIERSVIALLLIIVATGVTVFYYALGLSFVDSFYFVITILTTVGFGDYNLMTASPGLKLFGNFLMIMGAASVAVLFGMITNYLLTIKFDKLFGREGTKMKKHTILIGWNKTAEATLGELIKISKVVLITKNTEATKEINSKKVHIMIGDGTDEDVLKKANLKFATNVITCDDDDSRNIMTTLMVKKMNPDVKVISSANEVTNMHLIEQSGADEVISPDVIGGRLLTSAIFEESVVELVNDATFVGDGTNIEQIDVNKDIKVKEVMDMHRISVLEKVVDGERVSDLKSNDTIRKGERIVVFGKIKNILKATKALSKK